MERPAALCFPLLVLPGEGSLNRHPDKLMLQQRLLLLLQEDPELLGAPGVEEVWEKTAHGLLERSQAACIDPNLTAGHCLATRKSR